MIDSEDDFFARACKVPLHDATTRVLAKAGLQLLVRRDDLIDPQLSGNKAYKLFFNLHEASDGAFRHLLSFGGAYSNHLHALAHAGARFGFKTIGVIRGEEPAELSPTLRDARSAGMELLFISRAEYQRKGEAQLVDDWRKRYGNVYTIPEGGAGIAGAKGMSLVGRALAKQLTGSFDSVCIACGTGTSLAGLAAGLVMAGLGNIPALGFSVLKGEGSLGTSVATLYRKLLDAPGFGLTNLDDDGGDNWRLISGFHAGGYGKRLPPQLYEFWQAFEHQTGIPLDPVYTLKMMWGIQQLALQNYWPRGTRLVAVHSGGLQGRRGFAAPPVPQKMPVDVNI